MITTLTAEEVKAVGRVEADTLILGDCLEMMAYLPDNSIDAVILDPPYGTTRNTWDVVIPFEPMWAAVKRVLKPGGACVMFAAQPFTSLLITSNLKWFKYALVWDKKSTTGFLNAKVMPLPRHEDIVVFGQGRIRYYPQMRTGLLRDKGNGKMGECYGAFRQIRAHNDQYYPTSVWEFHNAAQREKQHPTEKPVTLMRELVRTYTRPGEVVLDFTMGSGSTGVACVQEGRRFIGIEREEKYVVIAGRRLEDAALQQRFEVDAGEYPVTFAQEGLFSSDAIDE